MVPPSTTTSGNITGKPMLKAATTRPVSSPAMKGTPKATTDSGRRRSVRASETAKTAPLFSSIRRKISAPNMTVTVFQGMRWRSIVPRSRSGMCLTTIISAMVISRLRIRVNRSSTGRIGERMMMSAMGQMLVASVRRLCARGIGGGSSLPRRGSPSRPKSIPPVTAATVSAHVVPASWVVVSPSSAAASNIEG